MCVNTRSQVNVKIIYIYFSPLNACVPMPMCTRTCPYTHMHGTYLYIDIWQHSTSFSLGVKIVVLFRSDVFARTMGRIMKSRQRSQDVVFDIVNETIARKLAKEPLTFPSTADAMQAWLHACDEGLFLKSVRSAPEPSKLNPKRLRLTRKTDKADVLDGSGS